MSEIELDGAEHKGKIENTKPRVLIFNNANDLDSIRNTQLCKSIGYDVVKINVVSPAFYSAAEGGENTISTLDQAREVLAKYKPQIVMVNATYKSYFGGKPLGNDFMLINNSLADVVPNRIPCLVGCISGGTIHAQDGRDGELIMDRRVDVKKFLENQYALFQAKSSGVGLC